MRTSSHICDFITDYSYSPDAKLIRIFLFILLYFVILLFNGHHYNSKQLCIPLNIIFLCGFKIPFDYNTIIKEIYSTLSPSQSNLYTKYQAKMVKKETKIY